MQKAEEEGLSKENFFTILGKLELTGVEDGWSKPPEPIDNHQLCSLAVMARISPGHRKRLSRIARRASPAIREAFERGQISARRADTLLYLPPTEQAARLAELLSDRDNKARACQRAADTIALAEGYRYELASQGIDSVIVEPGAYVTAVFEKREEAVDESRTSSYGGANEIPRRLLAALASSKASLQEVVDAIVHLIELPAGNRPLRVPIGLPAMDGLGGLNYISDQYLKNLLDLIGVGPLVAFQAQPASTD
jgi:hypothetical protein